MKQKYVKDKKSAKQNWNLSLLAGMDSLGSYQPAGACWCLWLQSQPQIWGLISWARKPRSISVCISGKHFLQFRSWSCSSSRLQGRKIGNGQWGCSERVTEGSFYGKHQIAILGPKSQQWCLEGWFLCCFLNIYFLQSRDIPMWPSSTSHWLCGSVPAASPCRGLLESTWKLKFSWNSDHLLNPSE